MFSLFDGFFIDDLKKNAYRIMNSAVQSDDDCNLQVIKREIVCDKTLKNLVGKYI